VVAAVALGIGLVWAALSWLGDHDRQLLNAGVWWWGWLVLPVLAVVLRAAARRRGGRPGPWAVAVLLVIPMTATFVLHDVVDDRSPAYWPVGWPLLAVLCAICAAAGSNVTAGSRSP
jgi:hypothetical protein